MGEQVEYDAPTGVRRSWLERVLSVVRTFGSRQDLEQTLQTIADAVVDVLDFGAAAINVVDGEKVRVAAVAGPDELSTELLGQSTTLAHWHELLGSSQRWGGLRFYSHDQDQYVITQVPSWAPPNPRQSGDQLAWHPDDVLLAPLNGSDGTLLGILSVDQPASGQRPDHEQCTVVELFATQAARAIEEALERAAVETQRHEAEQRWRLAFEHSPVGAAIVGLDGRFRVVNDAMVAMLGYPADELTALRFVDVTHPDDVGQSIRLFSDMLAGKCRSFEAEKRYLRSDGRIVWALLHVGAIVDASGGLVSMVSQVNDITDRKRAEAHLEHRATHDPLTDLPNRTVLEERIAHLLASGQRFGVLTFDVDRFKNVNDSLGHEAGDELLAVVANRLLSRAPESRLVGRTAGDQFVMIVPREHEPGVLHEIATTVLAEVGRPLWLRHHRHAVGLSVGITISGPRHRHPDEILREAEQALRRAKRLGRNRVELFDPLQDRSATVDDLDLENDLRHAAETGSGLVPYFQPIVSLATDTPVGYECLVRWQHPRRGLLAPAAFLSLAEQSGLIVPLGWWMLDQACRAATSGQLTDGWSRWVAVNVSASQLGVHELLPAIRHTLDETGLPPERLHVEITETALADAGPQAIKEVNRVADLGVRMALDDFGTGYSSLSLLRDLPVSIVKIDRSFVAPISADRTATAIVRNVIDLCHELQITTVGEGVETVEQLTALRVLGCTQAQGYLLGRPLPLSA